MEAARNFYEFPEDTQEESDRTNILERTGDIEEENETSPFLEVYFLSVSIIPFDTISKIRVMKFQKIQKKKLLLVAALRET